MQADDHLRIAPHRQADPLPRRHTVLTQAMGELVGLGVELCISQSLVADDHGQCIGRAAACCSKR